MGRDLENVVQTLLVFTSTWLVDRDQRVSQIAVATTEIAVTTQQQDTD